MPNWFDEIGERHIFCVRESGDFPSSAWAGCASPMTLSKSARIPPNLVKVDTLMQGTILYLEITMLRAALQMAKNRATEYKVFRTYSGLFAVS